MNDYAALPVKHEPPAFLYHKAGTVLYYDFHTKRLWFEGFDVPKGYRLQCRMVSAQLGEMEVYEKVSE